MDENQKHVMNHSSFRRSIDKQNQNMNSHCQRIVPISIDHLPSSTVNSHKRLRSSTINEQSDLFPNNHPSIYTHNILPITTSRKRSVEDDSYIQQYDQHVRKLILFVL